MGYNGYFIYPITVVCDRYSGIYSGGSYIAWNLETEDVPLDPQCDDVSCYSFFA